MASHKKRKGILGGTFNPVHRGHLHLAQVAMQALELDHILFIPSSSPPHKKSSDLCSFGQRLAMLEIAVAPYPEFSVSDIEGQRDGFSYTIDTLRQLHAELDTDEELVFLMGFDAFQEMATWKDYLQIPGYATIAVCEREGNNISEVATRLFGASSTTLIQEFTVPEKKISSSCLRHILKNNHQGAESLLPLDVFAYIERHALFR